MAPEDPSARQVARKQVRVAGDRSSKLARELMQVNDTLIDKLELDEDLHAVIAKARAVTAQNARRRAERTLAGELRRHDLADLATRLASVRATGSVDSDRQAAAERWRTRMLAEGTAAIAEFPGGDPDHVLPRLIAQAQREKTTGKPAGAGKALFRHLADALRAHAEAAEASDD